jgi:hypothetical protein
VPLNKTNEVQKQESPYHYRLVTPRVQSGAIEHKITDVSQMNGGSKRFGPVAGHLKSNSSRPEQLDQVSKGSD